MQTLQRVREQWSSGRHISPPPSERMGHPPGRTPKRAFLAFCVRRGAGRKHAGAPPSESVEHPRSEAPEEPVVLSLSILKYQAYVPSYLC